jgi:cysteinyl-tRNA synthetase
MAKSLANFISIKDFIAKYKDADYLKLLFLNTHYRHPVDYTEEKITEAKAEKERIVILAEKLKKIKLAKHEPRTTNHADVFRKRFEEAMDDDFNMPQALAAIFELVAETNRRIDDPEFIAGAKRLLSELVSVFGLDLKKGSKEELSAEIEKLMKARDKARLARDFKEADRIRKVLDGKGIILEDTKDGTVWRRKL